MDLFLCLWLVDCLVVEMRSFVHVLRFTQESMLRPLLVDLCGKETERSVRGINESLHSFRSAIRLIGLQNLAMGLELVVGVD